jgi:hypothetical protein
VDLETCKKIIARRHPMYESNVDHWRFLDATYRGGRDWFKYNIFKYYKEGESEYNARLERAYRFNHTREVVDIVNKHLFRTDIIRSEDAPEHLAKFWENATRLGLSMNDFAKVVALRSSIEGMPWVVVDNTFRSDTKSRKDEKTSKGRIFAYIVPSQDALDWGYGEDGELSWFLFRDDKRDDEDPVTSTFELVERYKLFTRNRWHLFVVAEKSDGVPTKIVHTEGEIGINAVPAVPAPNSFSEQEYFTPSLVADVAYLDRSVANYASNLDVIIQDQTFAQLALPAQSVLPGEEVHDQMVKAARNRIFVYDGESGAQPHYLSPDPRQATLIIEAIRQLINEIYHSVGLAGERTKQDNAKGIDNSSGVAKSKDFERVLALLTAKSQATQYTENRIAQLVCMWSGDANPRDDYVKYSNTFNTRDLWDELEMAMSLSLIGLPKEVLDEQKKMLIEKVFPGIQSQKMTKFLKLIDDFAPETQENETGGNGEDERLSRIAEEASRNRERAGARQSETKKRETASE